MFSFLFLGSQEENRQITIIPDYDQVVRWYLVTEGVILTMSGVPLVAISELRIPDAVRMAISELRTTDAVRMAISELRTPDAVRMAISELRTPDAARMAINELRTPDAVRMGRRVKMKNLG